MTMLLALKIFGRARNHGKKFLKLSRTSFSGIVYCTQVSVFINQFANDVGNRQRIPIKQILCFSKTRLQNNIDQPVSFNKCFITTKSYVVCPNTAKVVKLKVQVL